MRNFEARAYCFITLGILILWTLVRGPLPWWKMLSFALGLGTTWLVRDWLERKRG